MTTTHQALGKWGETQAARFLVEHGYLILERNARTPYGELDLVARQEDFIVFIEVKTRSSTTFGMPEEAVTYRKRQHLVSAALAYMVAHPDLVGPWRIDVIAVFRSRTAGPAGERSASITHFENAVTPE